VLEVLVQSRRAKRAAKKFLRKQLKGLSSQPRTIVTDKLASYAAARRELLPRSNIAAAGVLTIEPRSRISQHGSGNVKCAASNRCAMRNDSFRPTIPSRITFGLLGIVYEPATTEY
jgi:transposase-like protein